MDRALVDQLARQSLWLRDSWLWVLREKVIGPSRPKALEVGCGAGHVIEILSECMDITGLDSDPDMVALCKAKGLDAVQGDAYELPYPDGSFEIVYCSFLLLWLSEPERALREMARVSKSWVICLAEPDYGARIDYPPELESLGQGLVKDLQARGADPFIGRKLRAIFSGAGLDADIGVHQGVWPLEKLKAESEAELGWLAEEDKPELRKKLADALEWGTAFQYNPVFYALARKKE